MPQTYSQAPAATPGRHSPRAHGARSRVPSCQLWACSGEDAAQLPLLECPLHPRQEHPAKAVGAGAIYNSLLDQVVHQHGQLGRAGLSSRRCSERRGGWWGWEVPSEHRSPETFPERPLCAHAGLSSGPEAEGD